MKKRIAVCMIMVLFSVALLIPGAAATTIDTDAPASMTLYYQKDGISFPDLNIRIYRVGEVCADGTYALTEPYASYPVNIDGLESTEQWLRVASTLSAYITADGIQPDRETLTDVDGVARFDDLRTGLYLVREAMAEGETGTYLFNQFLIFLPGNGSDGTYNYQVEAKPKSTEFVPKSQYTVVKLWQDEDDRSQRPASITVAIYRDGVLQETQELNEGNNWTYTWYVAGEDRSIWTVEEQDVPEPYRVTIQQNGSVFTVINSRPGEPEIPETGDTFAPMFWVMLMCLSGLGLLILGLYDRRTR